MSFLGRSGDLALFAFDDIGVIVDESVNLVVEKGHVEVILASAQWDLEGASHSSVSEELAQASITALDIHVLSSNDRMYTIPKAVQREAQRALEWRKKHNRGGTPVGMNTARTLAAGGQIGIRKIRHIAKYFPRHEVDKRGAGYKVGDVGYPSRGRIAWGLWGGDAAERWARGIVAKDNKQRAVSASGIPLEYVDPTPADLEPFHLAKTLPVEDAPEFVSRVRLDGSGIDRLYMVDANGMTFVWDDGSWHDLGISDPDLDELDLSLDDPHDDVAVMHVPLDVDAAVKVCALLDSDPFGHMSVSRVSDPQESALALSALPELNLGVIDMVMIAAGDKTANGEPAPAKQGDGQYTPKERSANASKQVRDASGKFAKQGSRVVIGGDSKNRGVITKVNPSDQTVTVELDSGKTVNVPGNSTQAESKFADTPTSDTAPVVPPSATAGILGQPRVASDQPNVRIPGMLPPLTGDSIGMLLNDWPAWIAAERELYARTAPTGPENIRMPQYDVPEQPSGVQVRDPRTGGTRNIAWTPRNAPNAYNHPMLRDWLNQRNSSGNYPNRGWYNPIVRDDVIDPVFSAKGVTAAGEDKKKEAQKPTAPATTGKDIELTPETSDVPPMYMAIVAQDDPQAVMDLISLIPVSTKSTAPTVFKREPGKWVKDDSILADLNSPTPPPVVVLDNETLEAVVTQIDGDEAVAASAFLLDRRLASLWVDADTVSAIIAAGGMDQNRGNAEKLRRYWTVGKGGAKIRWNTKGDWTRCTRYLSKYLGPRAKGYCALRHKEMTGLWTGDSAHRKMYGRKGQNKVFSTDVILPEGTIIENSMLSARIDEARSRVTSLTAGGADVGATFFIPLVIPEKMESGDGRKFADGAIEIRDLPLPLMWQIKSGPGHDGSVLVGKITHMQRTKDGIGHAYGVFDTGPYGREAERLVRGGFLRGISADLDRFEADEEMEEASDDGSKKIGSGKINITKARVMAATLVPKPAFQECTIKIIHDDVEQEETMVPDGVYVGEVESSEASALVACGIVAGAIPVVPPKNWFDNPKLSKPTPLTVDDEGRVFGHIAAWNVDHIGMTFGTRPPKSASKYAYFHTGVVRADDGTDVPVGQLTLAGGHASLAATAAEAVRHYDDTASAIADVHAGEDAHGIWVAGALRPGTTPEQVRALRASAPSGDWRPIKGRLELVAVCQVNVPGFPVARARVASGQVLALVAAGASTLAQMKSDPMSDLAARVEKLEQLEKAPLVAAAESARARFNMMAAEQRKAEISARVASAKAEMGQVAEGKALSDDAYSTLSKADSASGAKSASVRRHANPEDLTSIVAGLRARVAAVETGMTKDGLDALLDDKSLTEDQKSNLKVVKQPSKESMGLYTPKTQPRDARGKFRDVLARLKNDLGDSGSADALDKIAEAENLNFAGNYQGAVTAASDLLSIIDRLDSKALNPSSLENVRSSAAELGKVVSNLPFAFGDDNAKMRYSDIPPTLRNLTEEMIKRVEAKIGSKDAAAATHKLRDFMSGAELMNQSQISSELSTLLRLLT